MIIPFIYMIRRTLQETEGFAARTHHATPAEIYASLLIHWRIILTGVALVLMTTVSFYTITARVGRRPLLFAFAGTAVLTAYPSMAWLVDHPSFNKLLMVELWLSFIYAGYNGAMVVHLTEIVPVAVRTAGFSLAYSLATTIGGSTPVIVTYLIHETGSRAMPGAWLSVAAIIAFVSVWFMRPALGASDGRAVRANAREFRVTS